MKQGRIWAEIDLDALEHNLTLVRNLLHGQKIMLAIKADAYGHGGAEIGHALQHKVDMYGVAGVEEGINLRLNGVAATPILVLSPVPYVEIGLLFEHRLSATVTEPHFAHLLAKEAEQRRQTIGVHIEVDTGMGRTGVDVAAVPDLIQATAGPYVRLDGIFTHFPAADSDFAFTARQMEDFRHLFESLRSSSPNEFLVHAANTAGFLNLADSYLDMIRPGLIVYGMLPEGYLGRSRSPLPVRPVMSLRSRVVNLRTLPAGRSISYERRYTTDGTARIAVVTAGYGDGYPYALTNRGQVLIRGRRAPIRGNVCMDLTMADVTDIPEVQIGDIVTLLGRDGDETITANELARWAETIPYEITCRVSPRVPRVFKRGDEVVDVRNSLVSS
jgi:alanine racemase